MRIALEISERMRESDISPGSERKRTYSEEQHIHKYSEQLDTNINKNDRLKSKGKMSSALVVNKY